MENLNERLKELLSDKQGTLTKVELHGDSAVGLGQTETGKFALYPYQKELMLVCMSPYDILKTSPIQSIELVEEAEGYTKVLFKTWTSTYEAIVDNNPLTTNNDNDKLN